MEYNFNYDEILLQVLEFMQIHNISPYNERDLKFDGQLHRYRTIYDKAGQKSGAYCIYTDGLPAGFAMDWHGTKEKWKFDTKALTQEQQTYFNSAEYEEKQKKAQLERDKERDKKHAIAGENARILFEQLPPAPDNFPYLKNKNVPNFGLHYYKDINSIAVPLRDIKGIIRSLQWINDKGDKKFYSGASIDNLFFSVALDTLDENPTQTVIIGEGYATVAKIYELTGLPVVAAITCNALKKTAEIIKKNFPKCRIIIAADNDKGTEIKRNFNPGINAAVDTVNSGVAVGYVAPDFDNPDDGTDWDDFAVLYGDEKATDELRNKIRWACMTEEEKEEFCKRQKLISIVHDLDPNVILPPQEFVGGLFPRRFVSMLVAQSGTGKTVFVQKMVSDLSMGGSVFDGFVEDEPSRMCLIFAGEAGYELLARRGAAMRWPINPQKAKVIDQYEADTEDVAVMLDDEEGWQNVLRLVDIYHPDIMFWDTYSSFHEHDENKAVDMKPLVKRLAKLARDFNIAVVMVHHSRKRTAKERSLSLNQDDVIGSSIMNRLVGLIIGIEPMKDDERTLLVRPLKTWFSSFMPFTYRLTEDFYGRTVMQTDLAPASVNNSKIAVWNYLHENFNPGEWFSISNIAISAITPSVSIWQVKRILADLVKNKKLDKRGAAKYTEYSIVGKA